MRSLASLRSDRRGTAAIEFAMISMFLFVVISAALDFALFVSYKQRLGQAVEMASLGAFEQRAAAQTYQSTMQNYIRTAAGLPTTSTVNVTVGCNGGTLNCVNTNRSCVCVSGSPPSVQYTASASCGATCTSQATSGYFMNVRATYTYTPVLVPRRWAGGTMTKNAVVRLQ